MKFIRTNILLFFVALMAINATDVFAAKQTAAVKLYYKNNDWVRPILNRSCANDSVFLYIEPFPGIANTKWAIRDESNASYRFVSGNSLLILGSEIPEAGLLVTVSGDSLNFSYNNAGNTIGVEPGILGIDKKWGSGDIVVCAGKKARLAPLNNPEFFSFFWSYNNSTDSIIEVSTPGEYQVTIYDFTGCSNVLSKIVRTVNGPNLSTETTQYRCYNQPYTLKVNGNPSATWKWTSSDIATLVNADVKDAVVKASTSALSNTYTVIASAGTCADTATITLQSNPQMSAAIVGDNPVVLCRSGSKSLNASGAGGTPFSIGSSYKFTWTPKLGISDTALNQPAVSPRNWAADKDTLHYKVTAIDSRNCTASAFVVVSATGLTIRFDPDRDSLSVCGPLQRTLKLVRAGGKAPINYIWTPSDKLEKIFDDTYRNLPITSNMQVKVTASDANGCSDKDSITLYIVPAPVPNLGNGSLDICLKQSKTIDVTPTSGDINNYRYSWSPSSGISNSAGFNPSITATDKEEVLLYNLTVTDLSVNCSSFNTLTVNSRGFPDIKINDPGIVRAGQEKEFTSSKNEASFAYQWFVDQETSPVATSPVFKYTFTLKQPYKVTLVTSNPYGCSSTDSVKGRVVDKSKSILIPTVFNPASTKEENKAFRIFAEPDDIEDRNFSVTIFNHFGEKIFETTDYTQMSRTGTGWNGEGFPSGIYTYVVKYKLADQESETTKQGKLTLVR